MALIQDSRIAIINTPLGKDKVVLNRVVISEQLSQPFRIEADLLSELKEIKFEEIIGQSVTITMLTHEDQPRYFNGIVSRFSQMGMESRFEAYRAEIVPAFWVLSRTYQSRIFQNLNVPDILKKVLAGLDVEWALTGSYQPRDYCVQYRETDLNFAARLMEEEGIYYFFKHSMGRHTMVIANNPGAHDVLLPYYNEVAFRPYTGRPTGSEFIHDWVVDKLLLPATYTHTDYDFESPKKSLLTKSQKAREHAHGTGEWYDFPGLHTSPGLGEQRARVRTEEMHSRYEVAKGKADVRGLQTGYVFNLIDHPRKDQNAKHLVTSSVHTILLDAYESGDTDRGAPYHVSFTTIPAKVPYRPQRVTAKPFVQGPQTAIVVGPKGEEIYTDKYGRVKVQFHWDRDGKFDQNSSCWVRVSQIWAGKSWGGMSIPRIGQEVVVDFLEGDPDQPIIVGRVYNGESMPPFGLPGQKVVSGVKTNSTPGGGGYNEFSMDDSKGKEKIVIHGQYDMEKTIEHNDTTTIKNDREATIGHNDTTTIGNNRSITVGLNDTEKIGMDQSITIGKGQTIMIAGTSSTTVGATESTTIGTSESHTVGGARTTTIGLADTTQVGGPITITGAAAVTVTAGGVVAITAGGAMSITGGAAVAITAGAALAISSTVAIAITAPVLTLNGRAIGPGIPPGAPIP